jgi:hypothetical protein
MRVGDGGRGFVGAGRPTHPIARPGGGYRPGWGGRPGYGYRPGYGWGAAAAGVAVGAGLAYGAYDPYYGYGYGGDYGYEGAYAAQPDDAIAECARRFRTYDPASQTYVVRKGQRARCP